MPTVCCAIGCKHVTGNGLCHLKRFPNDERRAVIWAENVRGSKWRRKGWELLCDCHFESSQFEKTRQDGAKKLRRNAIPTLFPTHTMALDDSTTGSLGPSITLDCQYGLYDVEPLCDVGIQRLPDPLLFTEEANFFDEAHFETSAYELHRVDGLKKLKQNAIPTICASNPAIRSKRKQIVQPRLEFPFDEGGCDDPPIAEECESILPVEDGQCLDNSTYGCDVVGIHEGLSEVKRLKTVHLMEIVTKNASRENSLEKGDAKECNVVVVDGSKCTITEKMRIKSEVLSVAKEKCGRHLKQRGRIRMVKKHCDGFIINNCGAMSEMEFENGASTSPLSTPGDTMEMFVRCFVCSRVIAPGYDIHLNVPAEASRTLLHQCLEAVLSFECTIDCYEVVCRRCCSLLNYIDRTEAELTILKGAISTCITEKNGEQGEERKSKLLKSEQILDRFSRGLDERNYVLDLEELFLEKADEENIPGESHLSQSVAEKSKSLSGEVQPPAEESEIFTDGNLRAEPFGKGKDLGQLADQERDEEITAKKCCDQTSSEPLDLCKLERTGGISKALSEKGVKSLTQSGLDDEIENHSSGESSERTAHADDDPKHYLGGQQKKYECKICCFKTTHESVMIWHLRVHMKTHRWCDFCSVAIPEQESVFSQMKKNKLPVKSKNKKSGPKSSFVLPAVPVEPITISPVPLTCLDVPLITVEDVPSESPVVLVDTQGLRNDFIPESLVEKREDSIRMEESQESGVVIISDNVLLSETPKLLQNSIPSISIDTDLIDKSQQENYSNGTSLSPDRQENETEMYCGILRQPTAQIGKGDNSGENVELNECFNVVNCCNVDENDVVESLDGEPCNIASSECVHGNDGLADSIETNFLDTLTTQSVAKYPEILPEICDEATDHNTASSESGVTHDNITNNDINFVRNNAIGESDLALAYESSVAALMCQSDDSNGMLY